MRSDEWNQLKISKEKTEEQSAVKKRKRCHVLRSRTRMIEGGSETVL
jgi:hypothetical protein